MATVTISLADSTLGAALTAALQQNMTLEAFIESAIRNAVSSAATPFQPRPPVNLETVLNDAVSLARSKAQGDKFLLKDLCDPQAWVCLSAGDRKVFGKRFRKVVEDKGIAEHWKKSSSNQAIYLRK